jgi:hypothetical protein
MDGQDTNQQTNWSNVLGHILQGAIQGSTPEGYRALLQEQAETQRQQEETQKAEHLFNLQKSWEQTQLDQQMSRNRQMAQVFRNYSQQPGIDPEMSRNLGLAASIIEQGGSMADVQALKSVIKPSASEERERLALKKEKKMQQFSEDFAKYTPEQLSDEKVRSKIKSTLPNYMFDPTEIDHMDKYLDTFAPKAPPKLSKQGLQAMQNYKNLLIDLHKEQLSNSKLPASKREDEDKINERFYTQINQQATIYNTELDDAGLEGTKLQLFQPSAEPMEKGMHNLWGVTDYIGITEPKMKEVWKTGQEKTIKQLSKQDYNRAIANGKAKGLSEKQVRDILSKDYTLPQ